ncbi:MAG: hypothetical protein K2M16_03795, partial [Muribaculaceae bacterium]|nr:hypothetical protein [Muribaculaceae bacterium]
MKSKMYFLISRMVPVIMFTIMILLYGCGGSTAVSRSLDDVERLMENRPDSALVILDSIDYSYLKTKEKKARYALLKSMALDKNYVDTTTFDVLQPAIDYYLESGTPDEKLRTYYYQGRIYQNRNERDSALHSFMRGLDIANECRDSLTLARTLMVQGILFRSFYDFTGYTDNYLKAAHIYKSKSLGSLEFDCLTRALNGMNILNNKERADSIIKILDRFDRLDSVQMQLLNNLKMTYIYQFGTTQDVRDKIAANISDNSRYDINGMLNLARAYYRIGDNSMAIQHLDYLDEVGAKYDTLKYLSIKYPILEGLGRYGEALEAYKDFSHRCEVINAGKFDQKSRSMEEKHRMEIQAERKAMEHTKIIWRLVVGVGTLILAMLIMLLMLRGFRIRKNLALEQVRAKELENKNLKTENELALEKARTAELENENLKAEGERLALENRNLQLERDNKALEAENLAHRVDELE